MILLLFLDYEVLKDYVSFYFSALLGFLHHRSGNQNRQRLGWGVSQYKLVRMQKIFSSLRLDYRLTYRFIIKTYFYGELLIDKIPI